MVFFWIQCYYITLLCCTIIIMSNETVARYPFSLTVHMKNGTPLYLDRAVHLNGDWELCLSQLYLPRSEITVFSDCKIEFRCDLLPKQSLKTEKDRLLNEKLKRLHENEEKQMITILIAAGTYDTEVIIDLINQAIQDNEHLQTYHQKTKLVLSNGKSFSEKYQRSWMLKEELLFNFKMKLKASESVVNLLICLVLSITQNMEFLLSQ